MTVLWRRNPLLSVIALLAFVVCVVANADQVAKEFFQRTYNEVDGHTNNWAVLVCASRYWFNYRVRRIIYYLPWRWLTGATRKAHGECSWDVPNRQAVRDSGLEYHLDAGRRRCV